MDLTIRLFALSPTVKTGPFLVPFKTPSNVSSRSCARGRTAPWQRTHEALNNGWISLVKVMPLWVEAGGSWLQSTWAIAERLTVTQPVRTRVLKYFMGWLSWLSASKRCPIQRARHAK
jgi:hypothetical protein